MLMGRMGGEVRAASPVCIAAGPESSEKALYTCAAMNVCIGWLGIIILPSDYERRNSRNDVLVKLETHAKSQAA